jgi:ABC-type sugar transport system substrate-binding protein
MRRLAVAVAALVALAAPAAASAAPRTVIGLQNPKVTGANQYSVPKGCAPARAPCASTTITSAMSREPMSQDQQHALEEREARNRHRERLAAAIGRPTRQC